MNLDLCAIYFCTTNSMSWGKGFTIKDAKSNAGVVAQKPNCAFYIMAAIFNKEGMTDDEKENLRQCIIANDYDGSPMFYLDRTPEDNAMIDKYHVGWLLVEQYEPAKTKK